VKLLITAFLLLALSTAKSQSIADNDYSAGPSHMMNVNYGQYNYFAIGYTYENNGLLHWTVDLQGTDEIGLRLSGGYRIGSEMYSVTPMIGATQFISLRSKVFTQNTLTASIRAQVWILNFEVIKYSKQQPFVSVGLRGNILK